MLLKYIPQVTEYDIRKYESLIALRHQLIHEVDLQKPNVVKDKSANTPKQNSDEEKRSSVDDITRISEQAQAIFKDVEFYYNKTYKLEIATRQFALEQGKYLQISPTVKGGWNYLKKFVNYRWVQITTLPFLWFNKAKYSVTHLTFPKIAISTLSMVLVVYGFVILPPKFSDKPEVSDIPDQTITVGEKFSPVALDEYVSDKDNSDSEIKWSFKFTENLKVTIDANRVATIKPLHAGWTGSKVLIFKATDPMGCSDCDTVLFQVKAMEDSTKTIQ